jgi:hypothetical protein
MAVFACLSRARSVPALPATMPAPHGFSSRTVTANTSGEMAVLTDVLPHNVAAFLPWIGAARSATRSTNLESAAPRLSARRPSAGRSSVVPDGTRAPESAESPNCGAGRICSRSAPNEYRRPQAPALCARRIGCSTTTDLTFNPRRLGRHRRRQQNEPATTRQLRLNRSAQVGIGRQVGVIAKNPNGAKPIPRLGEPLRTGLESNRTLPGALSVSTRQKVVSAVSVV